MASQAMYHFLRALSIHSRAENKLVQNLTNVHGWTQMRNKQYAFKIEVKKDME